MGVYRVVWGRVVEACGVAAKETSNLGISLFKANINFYKAKLIPASYWRIFGLNVHNCNWWKNLTWQCSESVDKTDTQHFMETDIKWRLKGQLIKGDMKWLVGEAQCGEWNEEAVLQWVKYSAVGNMATPFKDWIMYSTNLPPAMCVMKCYEDWPPLSMDQCLCRTPQPRCLHKICLLHSNRLSPCLTG